MFGSIGFPELVMIFIIALLLFGPKQLPNLGRTLGKALAEFKRASNDLQRTLEEEVRAEELRAVSREVREATTLPSVLSPEDQERGLTGGETGSSSQTQGKAEKEAQG
ncbi:MAG: Sec-independent protein translocase protein TatB [Thermoanaerobaculaceae bacterium]